MNWKQLVTNNFGWKLASLFIATIIWANYNADKIGWKFATNPFRNEVTKQFIGFQIQVLGRPNNSFRAELSPSTVSIEIKGEKTVAEPISKDDVMVFVDLSDLLPNSTNDVPVQVRVPAGIVIEEVSPTNITVLTPPLTPAS